MLCGIFSVLFPSQACNYSAKIFNLPPSPRFFFFCRISQYQFVNFLKDGGKISRFSSKKTREKNSKFCQLFTERYCEFRQSVVEKNLKFRETNRIESDNITFLQVGFLSFFSFHTTTFVIILLLIYNYS